jgi:hypothetical protein
MVPSKTSSAGLRAQRFGPGWRFWKTELLRSVLNLRAYFICVALACVIVYSVSVLRRESGRSSEFRTSGSMLQLVNNASFLGLALMVLACLFSLARGPALDTLEGRTPYLRMRGVGRFWHAFTLITVPALSTFIVGVVAAMLARTYLQIWLPAGESEITDVARQENWGAIFSPPVTMVPAWILDILGIASMAWVAGAIAGLAALLLAISRTAWLTVILIIIGVFGSEFVFSFTPFAEQLAPMRHLDNAELWWTNLTYGFGIIAMTTWLMAGVFWYRER